MVAAERNGAIEGAALWLASGAYRKVHCSAMLAEASRMANEALAFSVWSGRSYCSGADSG